MFATMVPMESARIDTGTAARVGTLSLLLLVTMSVHAEEHHTLRAAAGDFGIGAAVNRGAFFDDAAYRAVLGREYNMLVAENVMKMHHLRPGPDTFDFEAADAMVDFALSNDMRVRGHTLLWHQSVPQWLATGAWTRAQALDILHDHIMNVVTHFKGRVFAWDVVNEAIDDKGGLRMSFWLKHIGPDYLEWAFRWAHQADPDALLFYNDYSAEAVNRKSDEVYALAQDFLARGVPIHGVGLQAHWTAQNYPSLASVASNMTRLGALGLQVHVTELDFRIAEPVDEAKLARQAEAYEALTKLCVENEACTAMLTWGFTDRRSWVPRFFKGFGAALPFDENLQPKPAYYGILRGLSGGEVSSDQ